MQAIINSKLIYHTPSLQDRRSFWNPYLRYSPGRQPLTGGYGKHRRQGGLSLAWLHQYAYPWLRRGRYNGWDPDLHGNPLPETSKMRRYGIFTDDNDKGMAHRSKGAQKRS